MFINRNCFVDIWKKRIRAINSELQQTHSQEEKEAFVPKYRELLKATTVSSVEDVAAMADIDLCDEAFWTSCLDTCAQRIDEFLELTK